MFLFVAYQDIKEREVYWFLFPFIGFLSAFLFYKNTLSELFFMSIAMNIFLVLVLIMVVVLYSKFKLNVSIRETMGIGDILLLFFLSFSFSTISFILILISSLIFSLAIHLVMKSKSQSQTVPLAGYVSLFFSISYVAFWSGIIDSLYTI